MFRNNNKFIAIFLRILGIIALVVAVGNILEESQMMIYDLNGIILGLGLILISAVIEKK